MAAGTRHWKNMSRGIPRRALGPVLALLAALGGPACGPSGGTTILTGGDTAGPDDVVERPDHVAADGDADSDDRGADEAREDFGADGDGDGDADDGCTPRLSTPYVVFTTAADVDERPVALRSGEGFVVFGRTPSPASADGLRFQRLELGGDATGSSAWTLGGVELGPQHPLIELPGGEFASAFVLPEGPAGTPGIWVKIVPSGGTGGMVPRQIPGTDAGSSSPSITFDGTDVVVAWVQDVAGVIEIRAQHVLATTGEAIDSYVTVASGPTGTGEPRIVWSDTRHALAYFNAADDALHVLSLDGSLTVTRGDVLAPPSGELFVGYPALAWSGTEFGLAWETRDLTAPTIHLATFMPDQAPVEHTPLEGIVPLSWADGGQLALAFGDGGNEWGLAWRHAHTDRTGISLVRIDATDFHVKDGPIDVRPDATAASNPALAFNNGTYMISWVEQAASSTFPIYVATYGCTP